MYDGRELVRADVEDGFDELPRFRERGRARGGPCSKFVSAGSRRIY